MIPPSVAASAPQSIVKKKKGKKPTVVKPAGAPPSTFGAVSTPTATTAPPVAGVAQNPTPPVSTPPAPPQAVSAPPLDPSYDSRLGVINREYGDTLAELQNRETQTRQEYGLDDPTNPYSRAALLQKTYENRNRGTVNSMAARGQLYAGATQNALNSNRGAYDQDYDLLRRAQDSTLAEIIAGRRRAATTKEGLMGEAEEARLLRALEAAQNQPAPSPVTNPAVQALGAVPSGAQEQSKYLYEGFRAQYPTVAPNRLPPDPSIVDALRSKGFDVLDKNRQPRVDFFAGDKPRSVEDLIAQLKKKTKKR